MFRLTSRKLAAAIAGMMSLVGIAGLSACAGLNDTAMATIVGSITSVTLVAMIGQAYLDKQTVWDGKIQYPSQSDCGCGELGAVQRVSTASNYR